MGRRDDDGRPPIEILGADLGVGSTQQVALGPGRPKPRRGRALGIVLGVVVLLGAGLVLQDDGSGSERSAEEERDNQDRIDLDKPQTSTTGDQSTTTGPTTTTTTAPLGPILGEPVEGVLLVHGSRSSSWQRLDLTTGGLSDIELPGSDAFEWVAIDGGVAIPVGGEVRFHPILGAGAEPEFVVLGPGDQVLRAGPGQLWLLDRPDDGADDPTPQVEARLVDLSGRVLRSFPVPGRFVSDATANEIVTVRGGRVYAADEDGLRPIAAGWLMGTIGGAALVMVCDERGDCSLQRQPTDGGASRVLLELPDPDGVYHESVEAADGRAAVMEYPQVPLEPPRLLFFGPEGESLGEIDTESEGLFAFPQFLPDDLGLLVQDGSGGLHLVRSVDGAWQDEELPTIGRGSVESMILVTP